LEDESEDKLDELLYFLLVIDQYKKFDDFFFLLTFSNLNFSEQNPDLAGKTNTSLLEGTCNHQKVDLGHPLNQFWKNSKYL
jgi:hypothetical protein